MDFWNSNIVATITGAIVGGLIAIVASIVTYRMQRKDAEKKEIRENFKHKAELLAIDGANITSEKLYDTQNVNVLFCSYHTSLDKNGEVTVKYPKGIRNLESLKSHTIFFENIGDSDINELEIAVENPKRNVLIEKNYIDEFIAKGLVNYGILLDRKIRKGEIVVITIYYYEGDPVVSLFNASLLLFYRDSLGNICEQPVFPEQSKVYEPSMITHKEWKKHVNIDNNLELWKKRLEHVEKNKAIR